MEQLTIDQKNQKGVVEMRIHKGINIYDDAIASIKTEGLIGDMHVSIDPGGGGALLKPGGIITETQPPLDIADLVSKYVFGDVKKPYEKNNKEESIMKIKIAVLGILMIFFSIDSRICRGTAHYGSGKCQQSA